MLSSLSIHTPRLRTDVNGCTMAEQICRVASIVDSFFKFVIEPKQMTSILSAFSWRRLDEHQSDFCPNMHYASGDENKFYYKLKFI